MNGTPFKLGTFAKAGGGSFAAIVLGDDVIPLAAAQAAYRNAPRARALSSTASLFALLEDWDANFAVLQEIVAYIEHEGTPRGTAKLAESARAAAGGAARQDVLRRAEFPGACRRDAARRHDAGQRPEIHRREIDVRSLFVSQGAEHAVRRHRRHRHSARPEEDRLGGGDRARHRQAGQAHQGRARARPRRRLHDHQRRVRPRPANPRRPAGPALGLAQRQEPRQFRADGAVPGAARFRAATT